jgi:hypothetical protein
MAASTTSAKKTVSPVVETTESIHDSIAELVKNVTSRFSEVVPDEVGQLLAKPVELIEKAFDFTTDIIESQRDFVVKLVKNAVPSKS